MRKAALVLLMLFVTGCAGVAEHTHVTTGRGQSCDKACAPGGCAVAVDTGFQKAKETTCDSTLANLCICTLPDEKGAYH